MVKKSLKRILVPTDFSIPARNALRFAISLARKTNAKILLLHVYDIPLVPGITPYVPDPEIVSQNVIFAEEGMTLHKKYLALHPSVSYKTRIVPGYGPKEVPEIILSTRADIIVMGTKGASGLKKVFAGTNTVNVMENSRRPVFAIPEKVKNIEIKEIGLAYDNKKIKDPRWLILFSKLFSARLNVFHIKRESSPVKLKDSERFIKTCFKGIPHQFYSVAGEDVVLEINRFVKDYHIDILVLMPKEKNLFEKLLSRSISKSFAYFSKTPLLILPDKK